VVGNRAGTYGGKNWEVEGQERDEREKNGLGPLHWKLRNSRHERKGEEHIPEARRGNQTFQGEGLKPGEGVAGALRLKAKDWRC